MNLQERARQRLLIPNNTPHEISSPSLKNGTLKQGIYQIQDPVEPRLRGDARGRAETLS